MHFALLIAIAVFGAISIEAFSLLPTRQTIAVTGTTICNKKKVEAIVTLRERDNMFLFDPDDVLDQVVTNHSDFTLRGFDDEILWIEPYLQISHRCHVKNEKCKKRSVFEIPTKYINGLYEMTYIPLDITFHPMDMEICHE